MRLSEALGSLRVPVPLFQSLGGARELLRRLPSRQVVARLVPQNSSFRGWEGHFCLQAMITVPVARSCASAADDGRPLSLPLTVVVLYDSRSDLGKEKGARDKKRKSQSVGPRTACGSAVLVSHEKLTSWRNIPKPFSLPAESMVAEGVGAATSSMVVCVCVCFSRLKLLPRFISNPTFLKLEISSLKFRGQASSALA